MKLTEIASVVGGIISGDNPEILSIAPLEQAGPGDLTIFMRKRYKNEALATSASAILTSRELSSYLPGRSLLIVDNPEAVLPVLLPVFRKEPPIDPGISKSASISETASISPGCTVMNGVFISAGVKIGENTILYPNVFIGRDVVIGDNCILYPNVTLMDRCVIGSRCVIHPGAVIGGDGFGFHPSGDGFIKIPQIGRAIVGDDVEIGANTTIDRGTIGDTVIGNGVKLDNLIMIGHNVRVGENTVMAAQAGISGSTKIGSWVMIGGQVGVAGHVEIGDMAKIAAQSGIMSNVETNTTVMGYPALEITRWLRSQAVLKSLAKKHGASKSTKTSNESEPETNQ